MAAIASPPFLPTAANPLQLSQGLLQACGTQLRCTGQHHVPTGMPLLVVSNHRGLLDPPVLMAALQRNIAFACHPYMANVPVLREVVHQFGALPLDTPHQKERLFFRRASERLRQRGAVGIFPEGARPMVTLQPPRLVNSFQRGFAHLALRATCEPLALLPVALVSDDEGFESPIPLKLLSFFDPNEPLFQIPGGHPIVMYRAVEVRVGPPVWITAAERQQYRGRRGNQLAREITRCCQQTVQRLLQVETPS